MNKVIDIELQISSAKDYRIRRGGYLGMPYWADGKLLLPVVYDPTTPDVYFDVRRIKVMRSMQEYDLKSHRYIGSAFEDECYHVFELLKNPADIEINPDFNAGGMHG